MNESLNKRLEKEVFSKAEQGSLFSLKIGVLKKGKVIFKTSFGKSFKSYDLASMTKAIFTAQYFVEHAHLRTKKVSEFLPWLYKTDLRISDLLNHSSGLPAHKKFFKDFKSLSSAPLEERALALKKALRSEVFKVKKIKLGHKHKPVYSDLGFILLGFVIEEIEKADLNTVFEKRNKIKRLQFNELPFKGKKDSYAPTEKCLWRKKTLRGEVLDGNTHFMGGVAPHAGLFGTLENVLDFGKVLRLSYRKQPSLFKKQVEGWASGFMVPSGEKTTAGKYFSKKSIGHLGFTGTSFWYDPEEDLFIVILSNRTYPNRNNAAFNKFRPLIQNIIYEECVL